MSEITNEIELTSRFPGQHRLTLEASARPLASGKFEVLAITAGRATAGSSGGCPAGQPGALGRGDLFHRPRPEGPFGAGYRGHDGKPGLG